MLKKVKINVKDWMANRKKLIMCKKCYTFYYKNSWHFYKPENVQIDRGEEVPVRFTNCSACLEEESALYDTESNLVLERG